MSEDWLDRWERGRTGWHEPAGNAGLKRHWESEAPTVLVPLCGKTPDMLWLARRGHRVTGVELVEKAVLEFFSENELAYSKDVVARHDRYRATDLPITLYCGDYFEFEAGPFGGLYDRGALVAVDPSMRDRYVRHTRRLLDACADLLIITLEYDQRIVQGPPFSVPARDVERYFAGVERAAEKDDLETCPPKFREAGLSEISEVVWRRLR